MKNTAPERFAALEEKIKFYEYTERNEWKKIIDGLYFPSPEQGQLLSAHDQVMDLLDPEDQALPDRTAPLDQLWSQEQLQRHKYAQQPEVLLGLYLFYDHFDTEIHQENLDFYGKVQLYETASAPLAPMVLAARQGEKVLAEELFGRLVEWPGSRPEQSPHYAALGVGWMGIVMGFAGLRIEADRVIIGPWLPSAWQGYQFTFYFQNCRLRLQVDREKQVLYNESSQSISVEVGGKLTEILAGTHLLC